MKQEKLQRKKEKDQSESEDSDTEDEENNRRYKESECKICYRKFNGKSEKRTPRILTECGHSACTDCLNSLLLHAAFEGTLHCPFCEKVTFPDGDTAESLPKNYGIIGLLEEIEEERRKDYYVATETTCWFIRITVLKLVETPRSTC